MELEIQNFGRDYETRNYGNLDFEHWEKWVQMLSF